MHPRVAIRQYIKDKISALNTPFGDRIFTNRYRPIKEQNEPALVIYTEEEDAEIRNNSPRVYNRVLTMRVEGHINGRDTVDDDLDELTKTIEESILIDRKMDSILGNFVTDTFLINTQINVAENHANKIFGIFRITFNVEYLTSYEQEAFDSFSSALTTYDLDTNSEPNKPKDDISVPGE